MDTLVYIKQIKKESETGQTTMALLTGLANSTMLTRVALPSLGDLIQPLQNSGFMPVIKSICSKCKSK